MADMTGGLIGPTNSGAGDFFVRIRGIPWSCSRDEIVSFFHDCPPKNGTEGIHFVMDKTGKPSGEAYIELESEADAEAAKKHNRDYIGSRYIEVFGATREEMQHFLFGSGADGGGPRGPRRGPMMRGGGGPNMGPPFGATQEYFGEFNDEGAFLRLRGLPFSAKEQDLYEFFQDVEIAPNGIKMPMDDRKRSSGEAFIQFASHADADKAISTKQKEKIGHRYIEIFRSSAREFDNVYVEGWTPPLRQSFLPPQANPWMNGYGPPPPRAGPPAGYPSGPYPPPGNGGGGPPPPYGPWSSGPPPPRHPYGAPSYAPQANPYADAYWGRYPHQAPPPPGPIRSHAPPPARPSPYDRPRAAQPPLPPQPPASIPSSGTPSASSSNNFVFVRDIPPQAREIDIRQFFHVKPTRVQLIHDEFGRPTEAKVEFSNHQDAVRAMEKDKATLFEQPMDLFLCSKEVNPAGNGTKEPSDFDARDTQPAAPENGASQVFGSNYSYNVPPSANGTNGSNGNANGSSEQQTLASVPEPAPAPPAAAPAPPPQEKNYSFYGMVPPGWQQEYSVPPPTSQAPTAGYNYSPYGYSPYGQYYGQYGMYGSGGYGGEQASAAAASAAAANSGSIRKDAVPYQTR